VWIFVNLTLRFSNSKVVLWPGYEGGARCNLHRKNMQPVWFIAKKEVMVLQPLSWRCVESTIYHEWDVREEQRTNKCVMRTSNNIVLLSGDLYCCLLPQCEALRTYPSSFPMATQEIYIPVFRMPNTWKWPGMSMYLDLDLNLATFQYVDGFGYFHFCLTRFGLELIIFLWTKFAWTMLSLLWHCPIERLVIYPKNGIIAGDNHSVSLANIAVHYILQPIAGVIREAELFRRFIDDIICIARSESSNESIWQALTSAFANSGLELTFRQACTADQKGEVQFLDSNHRVTTDNDFRFVTKDFIKPTAMGVGRIFFQGRGTRGFFQNFSRRVPKVVEFDFSHTKLRKQLFLLKISKTRGPRPPFRRPCPQQREGSSLTGNHTTQSQHSSQSYLEKQ